MAKKKAKATTRATKPASKKKGTRTVARKAAKAVRKPLKTKKKAPKAKARPAAKAARKTARQVARKVVAKKAVKKAVRKVARKVAKKPAPKPMKKAPKKVAKKVAPVKKVAKAIKKTPAALPVPARLQRERKRLPEAEVETFSGDGADARLLRSARTGHDELRSELKLHTEASPELTADDVDAKWQDAYAVGDEAPGGDNPTPDQDRVDDIGKALGVVYEDDEELMGGDEISARDEDRWELDPASKEDDDEI